MACKCIEEVPKMVQEHKMSDPNQKAGYKILSCAWEKMSFYPVRLLYSTIKIKSSFRKVNGTDSAPRNEEFEVVFTYCPFCGVKYEES